MNLPERTRIDVLPPQERKDARCFRMTCEACGVAQRFVSKEAAREAAWAHHDNYPCEALARAAKPPGMPASNIPQSGEGRLF